MIKEQFIQLVSAEQESLRRFLLALCCGNRLDAEDIAQDTLIKAYLSYTNYTDMDRFGAWLCKIAYNTFLDRKRSRCEYSSLVTAECLTTSSLSDDSFRYQELYVALEYLSPKERTTILLYYLNGYSISEIAQILNSSHDAVKKQLSRGREHLKNKLKR